MQNSKPPPPHDSPALTPQAATELLARWQRLEMQVRCGLSPEQPDFVCIYVHAGLHIVPRGLRPALAVHRHMLQTMLRSTQDQTRPWFWRSVCMAHVNLPMAKLTSLLRCHATLALQTLEATVLRARDELPTTPRTQNA